MTSPYPGFEGQPALVAGELRGYRRFRLAGAELHPTVHNVVPWSGQLHEAACLAGGSHIPPGADCGCGLYGWYHPSDARADSGFGNVTAVIAGQGRIVLGDNGFRAQAARVEAVALPRLLVAGRTARDVRQALAQHYPQAAVYRSRRRMLREHPPDDLTGLGIAVRASPASRYRMAAFLIWLAGVLALYSIVVLPRGAVADAPPVLWLGALGGFLVWQAVLAALVVRSSPPAPCGRWVSRPSGRAVAPPRR